MRRLTFLIIGATWLYAESTMQIYKPVTSTCEESWISDISSEVAQTNVVSLTNVKGLKQRIGIAREMYSCNTSILDEYVFEGNVPPEAIEKFLKEKPQGAIGLSLPSSQQDKETKQVFILYEDKTYKLFGTY